MQSALRHIVPAASDCSEMSQHKNPRSSKIDRVNKQPETASRAIKAGVWLKSEVQLEVEAPTWRLEQPESRCWRSKAILFGELTSES